MAAVCNEGHESLCVPRPVLRDALASFLSILFGYRLAPLVLESVLRSGMRTAMVPGFATILVCSALSSLRLRLISLKKHLHSRRNPIAD